VFIIPGEDFFMGLENDRDWNHSKQCIRINYARPEAELRRGLSILKEEISKLYT
jgi:valine--pyruvate aminotransferase